MGWFEVGWLLGWLVGWLVDRSSNAGIKNVLGSAAQIGDWIVWTLLERGDMGL